MGLERQYRSGSNTQTFVNMIKCQNTKSFAKRDKIKPTMGLNGRLS